MPSLIKVFAVRTKKAWVLSYALSAQLRLWSDWADAQADLSLRWARMSLCWFCHNVAHFCNFSWTCVCHEVLFWIFSRTCKSEIICWKSFHLFLAFCQFSLKEVNTVHVESAFSLTKLSASEKPKKSSQILTGKLGIILLWVMVKMLIMGISLGRTRLY